MVAKDNIISLDSKSYSAQTVMHQQTIKICRNIITHNLPECFEFFDSLDDTLFDHADKAESNTKQEEYFQAMRHLRVKQSSIKSNFTQLIIDDYDKLWSSTPDKQIFPRLESTSKPISDLTLLQNDELEETIAIRRISAKCESTLGDSLGQLNDRFAHMLNMADGNIIDNPLSPDRMVKHLKDVISPLPVSITIKIVIYKQFELHAVGKLIILYQQLNKDLIKNNILPDLKYKIRKNASSTQGAGTSVPATSLTPNEAADVQIEQNQDVAGIFNQLRQLFHRSTTQPTVAQSGGNSMTIANATSILSALSALQQQNTPLAYDGDTIQLAEVREPLLQSLNPEQIGGLSFPQQAVSQVDEDTIDVIALLFEFILDDNVIPAPIRALLARLQIPMLKVAIADKTFFSKKNHPARQLLNSLAKMATGWSQNKNADQDVLYQQIESTVNTVLSQFDTDINIFNDLNLQLSQFIEQQEHNSTAVEKRITKASHGQEKLASSQREVDQIIHQLLTEHSPLPKIVVTLIEDGWKHVLKLRLLQKGKDSDEWKEAVHLMHQLVWSVSPKSEASERKQLLETIPKLLKALKAGLSGASFNQHKMTALFKTLQDCHIKCLNGSALPENELLDTTSLIDTEIEGKPETIVEIPENKKIISDEKAQKLARDLKVGTWLELIDEHGSSRIKFSWRSNLTGRCLFVTYKGMKAAELSLSELANLFQQGQVSIINQTEPLMDRALVSMMNTINNQSIPQPTLTIT